MNFYTRLLEVPLNLSSNTALDHLQCQNNQLTILDVTTNTSLSYLSCFMNQIMSLNVSNNLLLSSLLCSNNQLTTLNVQNGNNINFTIFSARNNPNLTCIQVDDVAWANTNWTAIDTLSSFSTNCTTGLPENDNSSVHQIFPNPSDGIFAVTSENNILSVEIMNRVGKRISILKNLSPSTQYTVDLSGEPRGLYFIRVKTWVGDISTGKIIIE